MKVRDLIKLLANFNPNCEVALAQEHNTPENQKTIVNWSWYHEPSNPNGGDMGEWTEKIRQKSQSTADILFLEFEGFKINKENR